MTSLPVHLIPMFKDNYGFVFQLENKIFVVDPGDFSSLDSFFIEKKWKPDVILITHHHWDHIQGVTELKNKYNCYVYGPTRKKNENIDQELFPKDTPWIENQTIQILPVFAHTLDHIAYYIPQAQTLFCGDSLFAMGCGRLFEGTYHDLFSVLQLFKSLPPQTQIYCAHEYSLTNAQFALTIEPENKDLQKRLKTIQDLRLKGIPTIPFTLEEELKTNPFLRGHLSPLQKSMGVTNEIDFIRKTRLLRDSH